MSSATTPTINLAVGKDPASSVISIVALAPAPKQSSNKNRIITPKNSFSLPPRPTPPNPKSNDHNININNTNSNTRSSSSSNNSNNRNGTPASGFQKSSRSASNSSLSNLNHQVQQSQHGAAVKKTPPTTPLSTSSNHHQQQQREGLLQRNLANAASGRSGSSSLQHQRTNSSHNGDNKPGTQKRKRSTSAISKKRTSSSSASQNNLVKETPLIPGETAGVTSTASLIDFFWPRRENLIDEKLAREGNGELVLEKVSARLGVSLTPSLDVSISYGKSEKPKSDFYFIPQFLSRPQVKIMSPLLPSDIESIWLSDSPFHYRTASIVFHPCDLAALSDGRKETKEKNEDESRPVIVPPPLRKYWANGTTSSNEDEILISPAIHSQLLVQWYLKQLEDAKKDKNETSSTTTSSSSTQPILFRTVQDLLSQHGQHQKQQKLSFFGLQRRVQRKGPNLGNITFFYSPSAAKSSPALSVIRSAGMAEDTEATHDNVKTRNWSLWWAKGVTSSQMACMDAAQKVNHFPGTWALGRKDNLNRHLMVQYRKFGGEHYGFFPKGYQLPRDRAKLKQDMGIAKKQAKIDFKKYYDGREEDQQNQRQQQQQLLNEENKMEKNTSMAQNKDPQQTEFLKQLAAAGVEIPGIIENSMIVLSSSHQQQQKQNMFPPRKNPLYIFKRVAGACGRGMKVITRMPPGSWGTALVQEYIDRPLLVNGFKFDLRIYVAVTSFNPLRVYVYREGLARFATSKYPTGTAANAKDRTAHLTNFSVNRKDLGKLNKKEQESVKDLMTKKKSVKNDGRRNNTSKNIVKKSPRINQSGEDDYDDEEEKEEDFDAEEDDEEGFNDEEDDFAGDEEDEDFADEDDANDENEEDDDDGDDDGDGGNAVPKWTFEMLHHWFRQNLPPNSWNLAWSRIDDVITKTLLAAENQVTTSMRSIRPREKYSTCFFELFGFDVLLKSDLQPVLMEVNIMCSLESRCSPLDQYVKGNMLGDCLSLVGVIPFGRENKSATPDPHAMAPSLQQVRKVCKSLMTMMMAKNDNNGSKSSSPSDAIIKEVLQSQKTGGDSVLASSSSSSQYSSPSSSSLPLHIEERIKNFHLQVHLFWTSFLPSFQQQSHLVDVIVYTEEERFRKGETFKRVYPPELDRRVPENNRPEYFSKKYSQFYQETRVADVVLAKWYELQHLAVQLMMQLVRMSLEQDHKNDDSEAQRNHSATEIALPDILLLLIDVRVLNGRFFVV